MTHLVIKLPRDVQFRLGILSGQITSIPKNTDPSLKHSLAAALWDCRMPELAVDFKPTETLSGGQLPHHLVPVARNLSGAKGELCFIAQLDTIPLRAGGRFHPRIGQTFRFQFTDGTAFAKSRNKENEAAGIQIANAVGISTVRFDLGSEFIVTSSENGTNLFDLCSAGARCSPELRERILQSISKIHLMDYLLGTVDRNESGTLVDLEGNARPIDHEYMFLYLPVFPMGKNTINNYLYLREILGTYDYSFEVARVEAEFPSFTAKATDLKRILRDRVASGVLVDMTLDSVALTESTVDQFVERLSSGAGAAIDEMRYQIERIKASGMFAAFGV